MVTRQQMRSLWREAWQCVKQNGIMAAQLIFKPEKAWRTIAANDGTSAAAKHYALFFIALCTVCKGAGFALTSGERLYFALIAAFFRCVALSGTWLLLLKFSAPLSQRFLGVTIPRRLVEMFVAYGMTTVFVADMVLPFLSVSFMYALALYNFLILFNGISLLLACDSNERGRLTVALSLSTVALPIIIERILLLIVPNTPL